METLKKSSASASKASEDNTLKEFFKGEIKDIYWAEKHLVKTLPKMSKEQRQEN